MFNLRAIVVGFLAKHIVRKKMTVALSKEIYHKANEMTVGLSNIYILITENSRKAEDPPFQ